MAPDRGRNRARDFDDLTESGPNDFDPEADDIPQESDDEEFSDSDGAADGAREHYVDVGKSKLRNPKTSALGAQYRGSRVARDNLSDEEDDPFGRGFEDEESHSGNDIGGVSSDEDDMGDETAESDISEDGEDAPKPKVNGAVAAQNRAELAKAMGKDQKVATSSLAQLTKADAEKGRAVKKQKVAFDSLLNTRIKLQKSLVGANTIVGLEETDIYAEKTEARDAIEAAETAAFNLWSSLNDLREELIAARTGEKRKRSSFTPATSTQDLWKHMQTQEESSLPHRNVTLQRWSSKTKEAAARSESGVMNRSANQPTIIDTINEHLTNRDHLMKRAHTPRSCAPLQVLQKLSSDPKIYDDADFYGLLLKELLEQKSADSVAASNVDLNFSLRKEAKTKKNVDTKASKGRKLRYTVHEKLQNFMAPEDRSSWSERQADELFSGLFGRRVALGEADGQDEEMEDGGLEGEEALMLFRG